MNKHAIILKAVSILLVLTFISSQISAEEILSNNKLAPSLVTDSDIKPDRSNGIQYEIAGKAEPGAIGNGVPLMELAQGKLPARATLSSDIYEKLYDAIDLAVKLAVSKRLSVPIKHHARSGIAIDNLISLQSHLQDCIYLYNADVRGPEDYLLGFNVGKYRGLALDFISWLYSKYFSEKAELRIAPSRVE